MEVKRIFYEDLKIAKELLNRNPIETRRFMYKQCYPLFKSIYDKFYTDCSCYLEFIDEIYLLILTPSSKTHKCQLENYRGESTLTSWLKTVCLYYCYNKFEEKGKQPVDINKENGFDEDRFSCKCGTIYVDESGLNSRDVSILLNMMPNQTYATLIKLRYIDYKKNEEVAKELNVNMANYYNMHKRAKQQFINCYYKEELCHE